MVAAKLRAHEPAGISHQDLNSWCVEKVLRGVKSDTLRLFNASHCNTLQHTATHCNILQHTATRYSDAPCSSALHPTAAAAEHTHTHTHMEAHGESTRDAVALLSDAPHSNTLQHTATHCNIPHHTAIGAADACAGESACDAAALPCIATQIVGRAGDVVLMHPLIVHCGSTNLSSRVRVMGNGMVRMSKAAFEMRQGMFFAANELMTRTTYEA